MTSSPSHALSGPDPVKNARAYLCELYEGDTERAHRFRYGLLAFDVATVVFIIATSFAPDWPGGLRAELAGHAEEVLSACLAYRGADGLFPDVLDEPDAFREANTAQLLGYAALSGVADGWLARSWFEVGADLLAAAARGIDAYGRVTGVSGAPDFERPGTSPEAQACHLLGHAALRRAGAALSAG